MRSVTNLDAMDRERFAENSHHVPQIISDMREKGEAFSDLLADSFGALYKYAPSVKEEVDTDRQLNQHIISEMMSLSEYKQLRNFTQGDPQNSAGSLGIVKSIWDKLPDSVKDAQQDCQDIQDQIQQALDSEDYDPSVLEKLFEEAKSTEQDLSDQIEEWQDHIRQAVRRVLAESEQETADTEQALVGLGWGKGHGEKQEPVPPAEKIRISQALKHSKKLQKIMRDAGRMSNIAQKKQHQKTQYLRSEIVDIECGNDLPTVLPSEFGYLMHDNPTLNVLFMKKFSQSELLQYKMESREPKAQGPVIVLIDCSGSMSGEPDDWSKACGLSLYGIARKQKRDFSILLFDDRVEREVYIKKGEHRPTDLISVLTYGTGGGTSFEEPLGRAVKLIKTETHKKADVIVITDGVCDISESFRTQYLADKKQLEFSTYTILIGGSQAEEKIAKKFSDSVTPLNDMMSRNEGQAFDVVFNI